MEQHFYQKIDKRSRKAMTEFLENHFRYSTMNSWNNSTSYANRVKLYDLGIPSELMDKAFDLISLSGTYDEINDLLHMWGADRNYHWQVGFNGRSSGYLVLYQGRSKPSEYKSYCISCGQRNFKYVPSDKETPAKDTTSDDRCGACGDYGRVNYTTPPLEISTYPGRSVDMYEDFEEWSMDELKDRVELVQDFDILCDQVRERFIYLCQHYQVEEELVMVPKTVKRLRKVM